MSGQMGLWWQELWGRGHMAWLREGLSQSPGCLASADSPVHRWPTIGLPGITLNIDSENWGANLLGWGGVVLSHALGSFKAPGFLCDFGNCLKSSNGQRVIPSPSENGNWKSNYLADPSLWLRGKPARYPNVYSAPGTAGESQVAHLPPTHTHAWLLTVTTHTWQLRALQPLLSF